MSKHTQPPWSVFIDDTGGEYTGWPMIVASDDVDATIVHRAGFKQEYWGDLSQRECIANAHLMASAPELREALLTLMSQTQRFADHLGVAIPPEVLNMYHAALAKSNANDPPPQLPVETLPVSSGSFTKCLVPSKALAVIVGSEPLTRTDVTKRFWEYIQQNGLQDASNRRMINVDDKLKDIFVGRTQVSMFEMTKLISDHLI